MTAHEAPIVSVIIPCYNHGHYLPYAVNSVLAQTFTDWEAIIVDDGSTDNTGEVAAQFTDPRIRYIYQENRGLAAARNAGIQVAQGDYLAFLDADDLWAPRFLERCLEVLGKREDIVGVYTGNYFIDHAGQVLPRTGLRVVEPNVLYDQLLCGGFFPPCTAVIRADVVRQLGTFDTHLVGRGTEDWDLWLRVTRTYRMQGIPELLAFYRVYPGSMSTNADGMHANRMAVLTKHFGPPEGDPRTWPAEKRTGYAFAYRATALGYIAQHEPDEGWQFLRRAVETDPAILARLDTFYELALGDQPRGYRGEAKLVDLARNGADMLRRLDDLFASAPPSVQALRGAAYGNAYLALAMLSDQAGDWAAARKYLQQAIWSYPPLLRNLAIGRRLLKLHLGRGVADRLRKVQITLSSDRNQQ